MFPAKPATEIMFGVTPAEARGVTMGSVKRVETLCGTMVNDGMRLPSGSERASCKAARAAQ